MGVVSSEVACQAVALCEGWRHPAKLPQSCATGFLDFARNDCEALLFLPFAQHRHKANRQRDAFFQLAVLLFEQIKLLGESFADGNDHAPAVFS